MENNMNSVTSNTYHQANQTRWNAAAPNWKAMHDQRGDWKKCSQSPEIVFGEQEMVFFQNISGQKVAVLGSGDNLAAFALAGMGAQVTSVDISAEQLKFAGERAAILGLNIEFQQADVTDLSILANETFDLVYTGGHVAVWVSDLPKYYREAVRILKPGGLFLVNEYHPFRRVWKHNTGQLEIGYDYYDRGPFEFQFNDDILEPQQGDLPSFEFHWRVSDFVQAILNAGCQLIQMDEMGTHVGDWEGAPMQGLPECLFMAGRKV
jgi:ubiquinone/menaquinone biosynthesis C-methylase UbiE